MHKTAVLLIVLALSLLRVNAEPPQHGISGYYNRGPPPPGPPGYNGPQGPYGSSGTRIKPAGPSKIFNWLGSKMPKLGSFRFPSFPKYKPSPYAGKYAEKVQISGATYNAVPNVVYYSSGQDYQIPSSSSSDNTVIYETHNNYSPSNGPSPGYELLPQPQQLFKFSNQQSNNMEILPSKMVSYQKEIIPENQQLPGVQSTTISQSSYLTPAASFSNPRPNYSQAPYVPSSNGPDYHNTGYRNQQGPNQIMTQERVDYVNYGSMLQDTQPQMSPMYDLSSLNLDNLGGNGPIYQTAASVQQPQQQVYNVAAPETVSLDSLLSSFNQQQGQQFQGQMQDQSQDYAQSGDTQGAYSQQSIVSVPAPNFAISSDSDNSASQGTDSQSKDLIGAESQFPGVQIKAHSGGQDGVFEVIADANAPTYAGGHPFDIQKLMSMIEPGAQFATSDIVAEGEGAAGSDNHETYVPAPQDQSQGQYEVQDNSGPTYSVVQQGTNFNRNKFNKQNGYVKFPDSFSKKQNETKSLKPFKPSTASSTMLNSEFIPNNFQTPGGNSYPPSKDKVPHDFKKASHDRIISSDNPNQTPSDNDRLTFGPVQIHGVITSQTKTTSQSPLKPLRQKTSVESTINSSQSLPSRLGTENPLANTRRFSEKSPLIIYHTIRPFISSNKNGTFSSDNYEHPNHNYQVTPSTTSNKNHPLVKVIPGLVPTVNSFFDSVSSEVLRSDGSGGNRGLDDLGHSDLFVESDDDLASSESRQVQAYSITVTPPTSLFKKRDEITSSTPKLDFNLTLTISPDVIGSSKNISSSMNVSQSQAKSQSDNKAKRFPVYQRQSDSMK